MAAARTRQENPEKRSLVCWPLYGRRYLIAAAAAAKVAQVEALRPSNSIMKLKAEFRLVAAFADVIALDEQVS